MDAPDTADETAAPQWRDARQVAKFLGVSVQHVYYLTDVGALVGITMQRKRLWLQEDLDTYVRELRERAQEEARQKRARFLAEQEAKRAQRLEQPVPKKPPPLTARARTR